MAMESTDLERWRRYAARGLGLGHLSMGLAHEVVQIVERMHGTISRAPLPLGPAPKDRARGLSGWIYRLIAQSFVQLERSLGSASQVLDQDPMPLDPGWVQFQSALNGVLGDQLAAKGSHLALPMRLRRHADNPGQRSRRIIFLHGLCMSEFGWAGEHHRGFCDWAQQNYRADIFYLRYNSGRRISDNGEELADLLEQQWQAGQELSLIGHSMGGLMIRSALIAGQRKGHRWPANLRRAAMLGSPHHGAPLERLGNHANRLLKLSPYVKPFSRLGDLRSAGIRDLRFGNVTPEDWQTVDDPDHWQDHRHWHHLPDGPRYLLLAASVSERLAPQVEDSRHDYLVPVYSALALPLRDGPSLQGPALRRQAFAQLNHMQILTNLPVYKELQHWMEDQ